ncbi:MAG: hypothetical protein AABZ06_02260, partial [Bdellovibrionota bacterium]
MKYFSIKRLVAVFLRTIRLPLSERGNLIVNVGAILGIGGLTALFMSLQILHTKVMQKKINETRFSIVLSSGIETMLMAYRFAEMKYIQAVHKANCGRANPFIRALKEGAGAEDCLKPDGTLQNFETV